MMWNRMLNDVYDCHDIDFEYIYKYPYKPLTLGLVINVVQSLIAGIPSHNFICPVSE
jgi:hypothetical protein